MSELLGMTGYELAAMEQAYTELWRSQNRAAKRKR